MKKSVFIALVFTLFILACKNSSNEKEIIKDIDDIYQFNLMLLQSDANVKLKYAMWNDDTCTQKEVNRRIIIYNRIKLKFDFLEKSIILYKKELLNFNLQKKDYEKNNEIILRNQKALNNISDSVGSDFKININISKIRNYQFAKHVDFEKFNNNEETLIYFYLTSIQLANTEMLFFWSLFLFDDFIPKE